MKQGKMKTFLAFSVVAAMTAALMPGSLLAGAASVASGSQSGKFYADYASQADATAAANELNVRINEEGTVLLKNENSALPGSAAEENVSVFGYSSESIQGAVGVTSLAQALTNVGFKVNPALKAYYAGKSYNATNATTGQGRGELSEEDFTAAVKRSIESYGDIAFVTVTRYGSEGTGAGDHKTVLDGKSSGAGYTSDASGTVELAHDKEENIGGWEHKALYSDEKGTYKHELMLSNEEVALLNYVKELKEEGVIKKIVYVINSVVPIEMYNLAHDDAVDGILMISRPGQGGLEGVANVIAGKANPSGKTNQIFVKDYTADPIWYNVGTNRQTNEDIAKAQAEDADLTASKVTYSYQDADGKTVTTKNAIYESPNSRSSDKTGLTADGLFGIDYEEDIYRDYWYYETVAAEMNKKEEGSGDEWYKENVVYPFGYGLSYGAEFDYEIRSIKLDDGTLLGKELTEGMTLKAEELASKAGSPAKIKSGTVTVKVTNIGTEPGKEAVELYSQAAYDKVETPHVRLIGFEKTTELRPGASQTLKIKFNFQDIAAYDWQGLASEGKETGYVLEKGNFALHVMGNSNGWMTKGDDYAKVSFKLDETAYLHLDDFSGNLIGNLFSAENGARATVRDPELNGGFQYNADENAKETLLSRKNFEGTFPKGPTAADMTLNMDALNRITYWEKFNVGSGIVDFTKAMYLDEVVGTGFSRPSLAETPADFEGILYQDGQDVYSKDGKIVAAGTEGAVQIVDGDKDFPWIVDYKAADMSGWTQAAAGTTDAAKVQGSAMVGKNPYDEAEGSKAWEEYMNGMTYAEMEQMSERGQGTTYTRLGLNSLSGYDGSNKGGSYSWASNGMVASTWNKTLVEKQGRIIGNLSLFLNQNAWWGGGAQTIRTIWAGRNGEFLSTDSFLTGTMAAAQNRGAAEKGIAVHIKHGILNDQTAPANAGMITWVSEQAIREIYARSFQMAIQEGGANAFMASYARVGIVYTGINYSLISGLIHGEWGAYSVNTTTDNFVQLAHLTSGDMMARAGINDMNTSNARGMSGTWDDTKKSVTYKAKLVTPEKDSTLLNAEDEGKLQWYLARKNATVYANTRVNSRIAKNGVSVAKWEENTFELTQGSAASNVSVAGTVNGTDEVVYTATGLPAGLTLAENGTVSGTPTTPGTYSVTVSAVADGWISLGSKTYTFNVASAFEFPAGDDAKAKVGEEYFGSVFFGDDSTTAKLSATGLPEGLTMNENGDIEGTPLKSGTYTVTVTATVASQGGGGRPGGGGGWGGWGVVANANDGIATIAVAAGTYTDTFVLTVEGDDVTTPEAKDVDRFEVNEDGDLIVYYTDGTNENLGHVVGADGQDGAPGAKGDTGEKGDKGDTGATGAPGKDGENGKDAEGGCGGVIGAGSAIVAAVTLLGAGAVVLKKKKD